jgi:predicted HNH restriction endonuclease
LWVIAGICWKNTEIEKPKPEPQDIDDLSFPEGTGKRYLHLLRERNQTVVAKAKALGLESDPLLRCQVCGFSFVETYGEVGRGFIEAHHKTPVAELTRGSRTHISDIGLVCANCHRILHRGDRMCSIEELRDSIQERRKAAG